MLALVVVVLHLVATLITTISTLLRPISVYSVGGGPVAKKDEATRWQVAPPPGNSKDALKVQNLIYKNQWVGIGVWKVAQLYDFEHRYHTR